MEASSIGRQPTVFVPLPRRMLAALGDERLVDQIRRGNEAAFAVVYDRHHRGLLSFCRHMLSSQEEAEDAVQQTFISAYRNLLADRKKIKLGPWLYTIARNRCLSMLRVRREQSSEEPELSTAGLGEQVEQRAELRELLVDLRELPHRQRAALVLAELGDLSHADIAEVLEVEPASVRSLVFQARSTLIEHRQARLIPCHEIREKLSTLRGADLRRGPLRKHLKACPGCRSFADDVRRQRAMLAVVLPVVPSAILKHGVLAAAGGGAGASAGAATAAGGGAASGGLLAGLGTAGTAKLAAALVVGGALVGGGAAVVHDHRSHGGRVPAAHAAARSHPVQRAIARHGAAARPEQAARHHPARSAHSRPVQRGRAANPDRRHARGGPPTGRRNGLGSGALRGPPPAGRSFAPGHGPVARGPSGTPIRRSPGRRSPDAAHVLPPRRAPSRPGSRRSNMRPGGSPTPEHRGAAERFTP